MDEDKKDAELRLLYQITIDGDETIEHLAQSFLNIKVREHERFVRMQELLRKYTNYEEGETMSEKVKIKPATEESGIQIVQLEPMRFASFRVISKSPEID